MIRMKRMIRMIKKKEISLPLAGQLLLTRLIMVLAVLKCSA